MTDYSRRTFLKSLAAGAVVGPFITRDLLAKSTDGVLRHASFGAAGMAWRDLTEIAKFPSVRVVAICDVDLNRTAQARKRFPEAKIYQDWRELLDKEAKNIDSVNVSTPDHMHAPIGMTAMRLGKHVYGQKPLAHDLHEVRHMTELARTKKIVTQMGIQIHSDRHYRTAVRLIQDGVLGRIKEIHAWCPKSWGDRSPLPERQDAVPAGFDWDLWLGVCAERPYVGNGYYHPDNWRSRLDFGTGTFGDMGCHIFDPFFKAIGLTAPISVRSEGETPNRWNWAMDSKIHYVFAGTALTAEETLPVHWYDGEQRPPAEILALLEKDELPGTGSIIVGTEGTMALPHWSRPQLYPDRKFESFEFPAVESVDHWGSFVDACLGRGTTSAHFDYSGPLTEAVLLGGVASRFRDTTLRWDSRKLRFDLSEANPVVSRRYRKGWSVKGL